MNFRFGVRQRTNDGQIAWRKIETLESHGRRGRETPQRIAVAYNMLRAACETIKVRPKSVDPDVVVWTDNVAAYGDE